jgi:hypothetical protein
MQRNLIYAASPEVEQAFAAGLDLLVIPVGGTHFAGRGLPLGFASVLAEAFALAIAEAENGFYLPVVPYSPGDGVGHIAGSICPQPSAFLAYLDEVIDQAIANEFRRIVVIIEGSEGYVLGCECFERNDHPILILSLTSLMGHDELAPALGPRWHKQIDVFLGALRLLGREVLIRPTMERLRALPASEESGLGPAQRSLVDIGHVDAYRRNPTRSRMNPHVRLDPDAGQAYIRAVAGKLCGPLAELGRYVQFIRQRPTFKKNSEGSYGWHHAQ